MLEVFRNLLEIVPISVTIIAAILVPVLFALRAYFLSKRTGIISKTLDLSRHQVAISVTAIEAKLSKLNEIIAKTPKAAEQIRVTDLSNRITEIENDLTSLRQLLFGQPETTITVPLMKKDIDILKDDIAQIREQIAWVAGYNRWFIGITITLAIALLGLAISVIVKT